MKIFRLISILIIFALIMSPVYANTISGGTIEAGIDNTEFNVIISGTFDNTIRNRVSLIIANGRITHEEYEEYTAQEKLAETKYVRQRDFDSEVYTFNCGDNFERLSWYTAIVNYDGLTEPLVKSFYYYNVDDMNYIVSEFNRISALTSNDMMNFIDSNINGFFYNFDNYYLK